MKTESKTKVNRKIPAPRNPYVAAAKFRVAGVHVKSEKAMRRAEKVQLKGISGYSSKVEQSAFTRPEKVRSLLPRPFCMARVLPKAIAFSPVLCH